jgi:hypothetical protein
MHDSMTAAQGRNDAQFEVINVILPRIYIPKRNAAAPKQYFFV